MLDLTEVKYFGFSGGADMVTPSVVVQPGRVRSCLNYESSPRGYRRVDGWEAFDGRPSPADAQYKTVTFSNGTVLPSAGNIITGASSGKTAIVVQLASLYSGSTTNGTATGAFPVMDDTGLLNGEAFQIAGVSAGVLTSPPGDGGPTTLEEEEAWAVAASEHVRGQIQAVPGTGPVRGVATFKGSVYAFRDSTDGISGVMHKATASGWQAVSLYVSIKFDAGTAEFTAGNTVVGATSGATGTIKKVVLQDGDWTTNDGVGRLVLSGVTGTFQDNEIITSTPAGSATADGTVSQITLPPGGRYHFDTHNFLVTTGTIALYGANGVGTAFEFDGDVLTPIVTGEENDKPIRIVAHSDHLFLAYEDGRFIHSSLFKPLNYEVVLGALLGGIGETITDLVPTATGELAIFGQNKVAILYGTNSENWQLKTLTNESGSIPWTAQLIGSPLYLDHIGVRSLDATQAWGNFALGTKTQLVQPFLATKSKRGVTAVGSMRVRSKDMYRLFWSDGSGISIYFGRKQPECMFFNIGLIPSCMCSGEDAAGKEILFFGSNDGFVYQMDKGTSANGEAITSYIRLPFNHVGSPTNDKRWHKASIEVDVESRARLSITYICSYGDTSLPQSSEKEFLVHGGGGLWNEAIWNEFRWSSPIEGTANIYLDGIGQNISLVIISESNYHEPHTIHGVSLHYNYRRLVR